MVVIVTGGAGFVGSNLVDSLLAQGNKVIVLDSLWTGSMENVGRFQCHPHYRFINHDIRNPISASSFPFITSQDRLTHIYHLACPASPDHFTTHPIEILETCFRGTQHMLDLAVSSPGRVRILLASTSEIYGDPQVNPQSESYWGNTNPFGPRSCYDEGKRVAESLAFGYRLRHGGNLDDKQNGVDVRIARIFNVYGPWMQVSDGRAVPNFISAAIEGKPLIIYGDGSATRSFQFVSDVVRGLESLMQSQYEEPVNIGNDVETRVDLIAAQIADLVASKMEKVGGTRRNKKSEIIFVPKRRDDPYRRKPDIRVAREVLGWEPEVSLRDGLDATVDWFLERSGKVRKLTVDETDVGTRLITGARVAMDSAPAVPPAIPVAGI